MFRPTVRRLAAAVALAALTLSTSNLNASGGSNSGGGGGGGGGSTKEVTIKYTGIITKMEVVQGGVMITIGTSYYNTGKALVTPDTKIKLNGVSCSLVDLEVGDTAAITALYPSNVATKVEAISAP